MTIVRQETHEEGSLAGWEERYQSPTISTARARVGTYSFRASNNINLANAKKSMVQLCPGASDKTGVYELAIGGEYWINISVYIPTDWTPLTYNGDYYPHGDGISGRSGGELIWQFQAQPDDGEAYRSPVLAMYIDGDPSEAQYLGGALQTPSASHPYFFLWLRYDTGSYSSGFDGQRKRLVGRPEDYAGQWIDFILHVKFHHDASQHPFTELWMNGVQRVFSDSVGAADPDIAHNAAYDFSDYPNCSNDVDGPFHSEGCYVWDWDNTDADFELVKAICDVDYREYWYDHLMIGNSTSSYEEVSPDSEPPEEPPPEEPAGSADVFMQIARAAANTTTGNQDFTTTNLGGATPVAALIVLTNATANDTATTHIVYGMGATDGTRQWAWGLSGEYNDATYARTHLSTRSASDACAMLVNPDTEAVLAEASFVAFIENGVRLNWVTAPPAGYLVACYLWAGSTVQAYAGTFQPSATQNAAVDITAPGFQPQVVITGSNNYNFDDATHSTSSTDCDISYGLVANGASVMQGCYGAWHSDYASTSYVRGALSNAYAHVYRNGWALQFGSFDAQGFSATSVLPSWGTVFATPSGGIGYLALRLGDSISVWCDDITTRTTVGTQAYTGPNFRPQGVLLVSTLCNAAESYLYGTNGSGNFGFGGLTAQGAACVGAHHEYGVTHPADMLSKADIKAANILNTASSDGIEADYESLDATGFTLDYSVVDGTARYWLALAWEYEDHAAITGTAALANAVAKVPTVSAQVTSTPVTIGPLTSTVSATAQAPLPTVSAYLVPVLDAETTTYVHLTWTILEP
jgi:hypothetical protein